MKPRTYSLVFGLAAAMAAALGAGAARAEKAVTMTRSFCEELGNAAAEIKLNDAYLLETGEVQLTMPKSGQNGTAFLEKKLDLRGDKGLHTYFSFRIEGERTGNGMAFLIQSNGLSLSGSNSCGPGYAPFSDSVVFEIDTLQDCGETLTAPHAAIVLDGNTVKHEDRKEVSHALLSEMVHAWVDYDADNGFRLYLSGEEQRPAEPLVTYEAASALEEAWAGFSAANLEGQSEHLVTAWEISNEGVPCACQPVEACAWLEATKVCSMTRGICVECNVDADCRGGTPVCDTAREVCVQCNVDADCPAEAPVCGAAAHTCEGCTTDAHCARFAAAPVCDTGSGACVQCTANADCPAEAPVCDTARNKCVECLVDADCPGEAPVCDTARNKCVECLVDADCPGETQVCKAETGACEPEPPGTLEGGGCACSLPGEGRGAGAAGGLAALLAGAAAAAWMTRRRHGRRG